MSRRGFLVASAAIVAAPAVARISQMGAGAPVAAAASIFDNFNDNSKDTTKWQSADVLPGYYNGFTQSGTSAEQNQRVEFSSFTGNNNAQGWLSNDTAVDLQGKRIYIQPIYANSDNGDMMLTVQLTSSPTQRNVTLIVERSFGTATIRARYNNAGSAGTEWSATYSATDHAFFGIRETGGDWFWETAPDAGGGVPGTWTVRRQRSVDGGTPATHWTPSAVTWGFAAMRRNDAGFVAYFDNADLA